MLRRASPFAQVGRVLFRSTIASDFDNGMAAKVDIAEASDGGGGGVLDPGSPLWPANRNRTRPRKVGIGLALARGQREPDGSNADAAVVAGVCPISAAVAVTFAAAATAAPPLLWMF